MSARRLDPPLACPRCGKPSSKAHCDGSQCQWAKCLTCSECACRVCLKDLPEGEKTRRGTLTYDAAGHHYIDPVRHPAGGKL